MNKLLVAADKEAQKRNKDMWTKEAIEEHGENFQRMVKEGTSCQRLHSHNQLQPWEVRRNQSMALQKFKAKKARRSANLHGSNALHVQQEGERNGIQNCLLPTVEVQVSTS